MPQPSHKSLLLIAYAFPPFAGSGAHRNLRFAKYLSELHWEISVLSAKSLHFRPGTPVDEELLSHIPSGVAIERTSVRRPLDALLRLRTLFRRKGANRNQGVPRPKVSGGPQGPAPAKGLKDFISAVLSFPDAEVGWVPGAVLKGMALIRNRGIRLLFSSGPPHSCHLVGWALKAIARVPWVADFRDPWTRRPWLDSVAQASWSHRGKVFLERKIVAAADLVILNTEEAREEFAAFYTHESPHKFVALSNGYNPASQPILKETMPSKRVFKAVHAGSFYKKRNPLGLLKALRELISEKRLDPKDIHIRFIGPCEVQEVQAEMEALALEACVEWIPWLDHRRCMEAMAASDLLLLIQPGTHLQIPGKVFEYVMLKKKILALTGPGATANLIRKYDLGAVVDPSDVGGIKTVLLQFIEKQRQNDGLSEGYLRALDVFNAESLSKALDAHLVRILERQEKA